MQVQLPNDRGDDGPQFIFEQFIFVSQKYLHD